jgi:carboxypeptidase C (cathepsin A)
VTYASKHTGERSDHASGLRGCSLRSTTPGGPQAGLRQEEKGKEDKKPPEEKVSQTKHTIQIGGKEVKYMATAGTMLLKKEDGTATASIFYIASVISWMTGFHL